MAKKQEVENKLAVGRHTGERIWGYEIFADGRIQLSPSFSDQMRMTLDRERGLLDMQEGIARFVAAQMAITSKQKRDWWNELQTDLGIPNDKSGELSFDARQGIVTPVKEEPKPEK